jgi:hypothetical protein
MLDGISNFEFAADFDELFAGFESLFELPEILAGFVQGQDSRLPIKRI